MGWDHFCDTVAGRRRQTTSEDRATQLLICEALSLAILIRVRLTCIVLRWIYMERQIKICFPTVQKDYRAMRLWECWNDINILSLMSVTSEQQITHKCFLSRGNYFKDWVSTCKIQKYLLSVLCTPSLSSVFWSSIVAFLFPYFNPCFCGILRSSRRMSARDDLLTFAAALRG